VHSLKQEQKTTHLPKMPPAKAAGTGKGKGKAKKAAEPKVASAPTEPEEEEDDESEGEEGPDLEFGLQGTDSEEDAEDTAPNAPDDLELKLDEITEQRAKNRAKKAKKKAGDKATPTVVYLGHIPFGFFEKEMTAFFGQFGKVNRLRMSRSKKTTKSRGFAFIEFEHKEVAEVVADTMDNYLLYGRLMKCNIVPADKVHADTFRNSNRRMRNVPRGKIAAIKHNEQYTDADNVKKLQQSLIKGDGKKRKQLAAMGIDYEFPGYSGSTGKAKKAKTAVAADPAAKSKKKKAKTAVAADPAATTKKKEAKAAVTADPAATKKKAKAAVAADPAATTKKTKKKKKKTGAAPAAAPVTPVAKQKPVKTNVNTLAANAGKPASAKKAKKKKPAHMSKAQIAAMRGSK